jgi:hypothetical protein
VLLTWELVVAIPTPADNGGSRHRPPVEALRFGQRRATSRFRRSSPAASAGEGAAGSTRRAEADDEAGEAVNAPGRGSTRHVNAPLSAEN